MNISFTKFCFGRRSTPSTKYRFNPSCLQMLRKSSIIGLIEAYITRNLISRSCFLCSLLMAQPLWNQKQQLLLFVEPMLHLNRGSLTTHTNVNTTDLKGAEAHGNGNNSSGAIDISEDVRRLCREGRLKDERSISHIVNQRGIQPQSSTYASLLQECINNKSLPEGKQIHAHMIRSGFNPQILLQTKLVIMYAKCGSLLDASRVLDEMPTRNVVSWTAMIAAYARHGYNEKALTLFYQMQREGIQPDKFAFAGVLPACANFAYLKVGKEIHEDVTRSGFQSDVVVGSALIDMYAKCGGIEDARQVFDKMSERNVVSWTAIIAGYAQNGQVDEALKLFQKMPERDTVSWNAMIAGYVQNGEVDKALTHFQQMPERNAVSWTAMISGYARNGQVDEAFKLFQKMPERHMISWNVMIAGYAQNGQVDKALRLFQKALERDIVSWNAMIAGYLQDEYVDEALKLFQKMTGRDVVSWTVMIAGCAQSGRIDEALRLFHQMQLTGVKPDSVTFTSILPACANLTALRNGKEIHENIIRSGFQSHVSVGNALVDMYAKCGSLDDAWQVFDKMHVRDVVSWNALIAGYDRNGKVDEALKLFQKMPERDEVSWNAMIAGFMHNGHFNETLKLFRQMQLIGVKPNSVTFASILPACANSADLIKGKEIHENIIRSGFQSHLSVRSALVDMYAKCGIIQNACKLFDKMPERDIASWNAMIVGYAKHGHGNEALQLFAQMQLSNLKPNDVTFIGVLSACSHSGLVDDGWQYFDCMCRDYNITPAVEHYCCMVDLLGRAGHLDEAQDFINKMPIKPNAAVWGSLLGACRIHSNIELGEHVAECLFELDPKKASFYVLMSNIYAASGRWYDVEKVRKMMKDRRVNKDPGCSWIEVNNKVYSFLVRDRLHTQTHKFY